MKKKLTVKEILESKGKKKLTQVYVHTPLEANACGLPIITFGKTALKNYVKHNYNGVIVNDYNELPFAMSKMMSQKKAAKTIIYAAF